MEEKETVVATVPEVETQDETGLRKQVTDIEFRAESIVIQDDEDYAAAGEFGIMLKRKSAEVTEFFKTMKDSAYQAHKAVCDREKAMLAPLKNAESTIKKSMSAYYAEKERKRREIEEEARRAAEAERERLLAEAQKKEAEGDSEAAEAKMTEAVVMDEASTYTVQAPPDRKVAGVSTSKDWEIVSVDGNVVPLTVAGIEIRPVDQSAVMRLIRASKGKIEIPGIAYREVAKMSFRR